MDYPFDAPQDNLFIGKPWLALFSGTSARNVPVETVGDIACWLQALKRMTAFL